MFGGSPWGYGSMVAQWGHDHQSITTTSIEHHQSITGDDWHLCDSPRSQLLISLIEKIVGVSLSVVSNHDFEALFEYWCELPVRLTSSNDQLHD